MRSVFVFLRDTTEAEVASFLEHAYPNPKGPPWLSSVGAEPSLYIDFYHDGPRECEPEEWSDLVASLGGGPIVGVTADVSGRRPGDEEVYEFITKILTRFSGVANDDYTTHLWTLTELQTGHRVEGHVFFDHEGWYDERLRESQ